jgi:hypothetical protein
MCEAHCSRRMCWSREIWREQNKRKEKTREKKGDKGNNSTPSPRHYQKTNAIRFVFWFFFFFFFSLDSSAPMCLHQKNHLRLSQCVCVCVCVPVRYVKTLIIKKGNPSCCAPMIQFPDTSINARTPNPKTNVVEVPMKDSDRRMYVLYMQ